MDQYLAVLQRCRRDPHADRQQVFSDIYGLTDEELSYLIQNGGLLLHEEMPTLEKTFRAYQDLPIESAVTELLLATGQRYPTEEPLVVKVYPMSPNDTFGIERLGGVSGWVDWDGHTMELVVLPVKTSFPALQSTVVHEYHHHYRMMKTRINGANIPLLELLIREGMAEHFVTEILGDKARGPWVYGLTESEAQHLWYGQYWEHLDDHGDAANPYIFGAADSGLPLWAGYALGYYLVGWYRAAHAGLSMADLSRIPARAFVDTVPPV